MSSWYTFAASKAYNVGCAVRSPLSAITRSCNGVYNLVCNGHHSSNSSNSSNSNMFIDLSRYQEVSEEEKDDSKGESLREPESVYEAVERNNFGYLEEHMNELESSKDVMENCIAIAAACENELMLVWLTNSLLLQSNFENMVMDVDLKCANGWVNVHGNQNILKTLQNFEQRRGCL